MSAPKNNQFGVKGDAPATSWIQVRVTPTDKARWVKAANLRKQKLSEWVIEKLNAASGQ